MTVTSPAARLRWLFAYRTLLKYLVLREIKTKSRGTYLGIGWTLMNPLFTIVVYFVIFRHIFRVRDRRLSRVLPARIPDVDVLLAVDHHRRPRASSKAIPW